MECISEMPCALRLKTVLAEFVNFDFSSMSLRAFSGKIINSTTLYCLKAKTSLFETLSQVRIYDDFIPNKGLPFCCKLRPYSLSFCLRLNLGRGIIVPMF